MRGVGRGLRITNQSVLCIDRYKIIGISVRVARDATYPGGK